jgi:CubicO group peptidase (beta-lactamase class C family)
MKLAKYVALCWLYVALAAASVRAQEAPRGVPEEVGLSSAKLDRALAVAKDMVDKKQTAGVVSLIMRRGKVARLDTVGMMDIDAGKPMQPDTIFRIYSMTKPITTVAAAILWEEGRFQLDDPVSKYLPEFKNLRVYAGKGKEPEALKREVTIRDLMRHTSGLTYGVFTNTGVDAMYRDKKVLDPSSTLADMVAKLSTIPLLYQPGTHFHYGVSTDVLGRLVEVVSGKPFDEFLQERIFKPLDMKDTGFFVPQDKLARFAANYGPVGNVDPLAVIRGSVPPGLKCIEAPATSRFRSKPKLLSGGGGLVSTARDYGRFCQMVLNGGELNGTRLLHKETVEQMTSNQLPPEAMPLSMSGFKREGVGFGLGFSVRVAKNDAEPGASSVGEYGWGGAASTHFWISPRQELVVILLQQFMPFTQRLEAAVKPIIYDAIVD